MCLKPKEHNFLLFMMLSQREDLQKQPVLHSVYLHNMCGQKQIRHNLWRNTKKLLRRLMAMAYTAFKVRVQLSLVQLFCTIHPLL